MIDILERPSRISDVLPVMALAWVGMVALSLLPSAELTLAPGIRSVVTGAALICLLLSAVSVIRRISNHLVASEFLSFVITLNLAILLILSAAISAAAGYAIWFIGVMGLAALLRAYQCDDRVSVALFAVFLCAVLLAFPLNFLRDPLTTGDFLLRSLAAPAKWDDWFYHYPLVASIFREGVASTGLDGVVTDRYHVGGHYFLAGIYRLLAVPIETSPVVLAVASSYVWMLAVLMPAVHTLVRTPDFDIAATVKLKAGAVALLAGLVWLLLERGTTFFFPTWTRHLAILSNGVSLPLAGLIYAYAVLVVSTKSNSLSTKVIAALLPLLLFVSMTKISNGLIVYSVLSASLALRMLFDVERRRVIPAAICWWFGGAVMLGAAYLYVSILTTSNVSLFDPDVAAKLYTRSRNWIWSSIYLGLASLALWLVWLKISGGFSLARAAFVVAVHLVGVAACLFVLASGVVTHGTDMVYFFISLLQIHFFSCAFAFTLIVAALLSPLAFRAAGSARSIDRRVVASAGIALLVVLTLGARNVYAVAAEQLKASRHQICKTIGDRRCASIGRANGETLLKELGKKSVTAKLAFDVRRLVGDRGSDFVLLVDKRTGFFEWGGENKRNLKLSGCYSLGWSLYAATGVALKWGLSQGNQTDQLCPTPSKSQAYLWRRYGYGSYTGLDASARSYDPASLMQACEFPAARDKTIVYVDPDLRLEEIKCSE